MKRLRFAPVAVCALTTAAVCFFAADAAAHDTGAAHVHFQKPQINSAGASTPSSGAPLEFRSARRRTADAPTTPSLAAPPSTDRAATPRQPRQATTAAKPISAAPRVAARQAPPRQSRPTKPAFVVAAERQARARRQPPQARDDAQVTTVSHGRVIYQSQMRDQVQQAGHCDACIGPCDMGPSCGIADPGCGMFDPGCGCPEPECGCAEPACGCAEPYCGCPEASCGMGPACGCPEPSCGCGFGGCGSGVGCGSCVARPGPDYDCIPICIPRFKDLTLWAGVNGFKGPRDAPAFGGPSDGNFGFQQGVNIGGRAPLIGLLFPQLSYQLGYQAVQSRLSGTTGPAANPMDDRSQQFFTGGLFRRVPVGLQYGVVFDLMRDNYQTSEDFHQVRYEISMKSPRGREIGFWGATHTNTARVAGINYQAVDQYAGFYRWHFGTGSIGRIWGGASNDNEGIFGADFEMPLNDRWSLQSGFNYLITDRDEGPDGAREEAWNVGMNLVWHWGRNARKGRCNPYRPMFRVADNGWMFVDQEP